MFQNANFLQQKVYKSAWNKKLKYTDINHLSNSEININVSGKFRLGDIRHNLADLSKSKDILGFTPKYNFKRGITEFVNWVKTQEVMEDKYEKSIQQLKNKGLMK